MTFEEFTKLVDQHDLTFSYSDDSSSWRRGRDQLERINTAQSAFPIEDVRRVWNAAVDRKISPAFREQFYMKPEVAA